MHPHCGDLNHQHLTTLRGAPGPIGVYPVLTDWGEMTSWETLPRLADQPVTESVMTPDEGWKFFDVTAVIHGHDRPSGTRLKRLSASGL